MSLKMHGLLREEPYALSIAASSLKEFLAMAHTGSTFRSISRVRVSN